MILAEQRWHTYKTPVVIEGVIPLYALRPAQAVGPECREMLDGGPGVKFIAYYKDYLKSHADTTRLAGLDIDKHLEEWTPKQGKTKDHTVAVG